MKNAVSPRARRTVVERLVTEQGLWQRHACELMSLQRSSARYVRQPRSDEAATIGLIREYAHEQPMYGYRIIAAMLKPDGSRINRKRVYRIWRQEGLQRPRRKTMKRRYGDATGTLRRASMPNEVWTYDFLEGRAVRTAAWATCPRLCLQTRLDSHSMWSSYWGQIT